MGEHYIISTIINVFFISVFVLITSYFVTLSNSINRINHMSIENTKEIHKNFLITLAYLIFIASMLIMLPTAFIFYCLFSR